LFVNKTPIQYVQTGSFNPSILLSGQKFAVKISFFNANGKWQIQPSRWDINPIEAYEQKEFMDAFYQCLSQMPQRLAGAFVYREIDGLSTEEICKILDITSSNCWVMLYRARMLLRRCIETNWTRSTALGWVPVKHWMFCCQDVSQKFSESMDRKLPFHQRMFVRIHQLMCRYCTRFRRQLLLLKEVGKSDKIAVTPQDFSAELSREARERIKALLKT
jgi:DNA-directed RNA polymerase specialized sigma24 family protein